MRESNKIPKTNFTVEKIYSNWEAKGKSETRRGYLGISSLGSNCKRKLWYSFRFCSEPNFDGRTYRLFNRGHLEEERFIQDLRDIGCTVKAFDDNGEQFEIVSMDGHLKGHADGIAKGFPEAPETWHLLEFKTSNQNSFNKLEKNGVKKSNYTHYVQMQMYMHFLELTRAVYLVVNKNDERLYSERIKLDKNIIKEHLEYADLIIKSYSPPDRISEDKDYYECKFCEARDLCHGTSEIAVPIPKLNCRQCIYNTPIQDGKWKCSKHDRETDGTPCSKHLLIPSLINFASPVDTRVDDNGDDVIEYEKEDGTIFEHGNDVLSGQYNSVLLTCLTKDLTTKSFKGIEAMDEMKRLEEETPLVDKYNSKKENVRVLWSGDKFDLNEAWGRLFETPMGFVTKTEQQDNWKATEFCYSECILCFDSGYSEIRTINKNTK
jgi:hypothetical protein